MKDRDFMDIGRIMDEIFSAAEEFGQAFTEGFGPKAKWHSFGWHEGRDYYPGYVYPPANVYMTDDKSIVFEFALAGFAEKDITLEFKGDYLTLSAKASGNATEREDAKYFKHRLKFKDIAGQKYYVPQDKFDQQASRAKFRNGILTVTVPAREEAGEKEGFKVDIDADDKGDKGETV